MKRSFWATYATGSVRFLAVFFIHLEMRSSVVLRAFITQETAVVLNVNDAIGDMDNLPPLADASTVNPLRGLLKETSRNAKYARIRDRFKCRRDMSSNRTAWVYHTTRSLQSTIGDPTGVAAGHGCGFNAVARVYCVRCASGSRRRFP